MSYNLPGIIPQGHQNFGSQMAGAMDSMWNVNQANQQASLANKALGAGGGGGIPPMQPYNLQQPNSRQVRFVGGDAVPVGYNQSHWGGGSGGPFAQTMGYNLADPNQRPMYEQSMNAMRGQRQQDMNMNMENQRQKLRMMMPLFSQMFGFGMGGMGGGGRGAQYNTNFGASGSAY
jgi:hypothetical protein